MTESIDEKITDFRRELTMKLYDEIASKVSPEVMNQVIKQLGLEIGRPLKEITDSIDAQVKDDLKKSTDR